MAARVSTTWVICALQICRSPLENCARRWGSIQRKLVTCMLLSVHLKNKSSHNWSTSRPWCYFKMSRSLHGAGETPNQSEASLCCMLFRKWLNLYLCPLAPTHTQTKSMWKSNTQLLLDHSRQPATLFYREFIQFWSYENVIAAEGSMELQWLRLWLHWAASSCVLCSCASQLLLEIVFVPNRPG